MRYTYIRANFSHRPAAQFVKHLPDRAGVSVPFVPVVVVIDILGIDTAHLAVQLPLRVLTRLGVEFVGGHQTCPTPPGHLLHELLVERNRRRLRVRDCRVAFSVPFSSAYHMSVASGVFVRRERLREASVAGWSQAGGCGRAVCGGGGDGGGSSGGCGGGGTGCGVHPDATAIRYAFHVAAN